MSGFSTYLAQQIIQITLRGVSYTIPAGHYLALFTSDPTDNNTTANEVAGTWYARQTTGAWTAPVGTGNSTSNTSQITFPAVTTAAVTVTHWGMYDAVTLGNLLYSGALTSSKTLGIGDVLVVGANQLVLTIE
jgi:hypothetical protein